MLLTTRVALKCYAVCREAERSIHYSLGGDSRWREARAYYNERKLCMLVDVLNIVRCGRDAHMLPNCDKLNKESSLMRILNTLILPLPRIIGCIKLSPIESIFIASSINCVLGLLNDKIFPTDSRLIDTRICLTFCQGILEPKLFCLEGLKVAKKIKHFGQFVGAKSIPIDDFISAYASVGH